MPQSAHTLWAAPAGPEHVVPQAHQLLTGAFPFVDRISPNRPDMARVLRAILRDSVDFSHRHWRGISGDAKHFVAVLLAKDAASRPTAKQVCALGRN